MPPQPGHATTSLHARHYAVYAVIVFFVAIASAPVFRAMGPYATLLWKTFWVVLCFAGTAMAHRMSPLDIPRELGLRGPLMIGLLVGILASLPMLLVLAVSSSATLQFNAPAILSTGLLAPFTEELLFRGYLFHQLYARAGWSLPAAVFVTALLFGVAHLQSLAGAGDTTAILGEIGMIAIGGAFYAWLFVRWRSNLWVPIGIHAFMNLSCEIFGCDREAGTWSTNLGRVLAVITAVAMTVLYRRRQALIARAA